MSRRDDAKDSLKSYCCLERDDKDTVGVLLSDEIRYYANLYKMIYPFEECNLKPAAYELTIGDQYALDGRIHCLEDAVGKNTIQIEPFKVIVVKTFEVINLPRFVIARWNIRIKWAYEGLLWVGGPQVDPGWVGHLQCPIYNLSNKNVALKMHEPIAIIDFVKTTPFSNSCVKYGRPPKRVVFDDYDVGLKSALFTEAREKINGVEKKVDEFDVKINYTIGTIFTALAIIVATLAIFVSTNVKDGEKISIWIYVSVVLSIISVSISLFKDKTSWKFKGFVCIFIFIIGLCLGRYLYLLL